MRTGARAGVFVLLLTALSALALPAANAASSPRHIVDSKYQISFFAPTGWGNAKLMTTTWGAAKVWLYNSSVPGVETCIGIKVMNGRESAADLASQTRGDGATVLGSRLTSFPAMPNIEQMTFTLVSSGVLVHGTTEAFYANSKTYDVIVESNAAPLVAKTINKVMATWGK